MNKTKVTRKYIKELSTRQDTHVLCVPNRIAQKLFNTISPTFYNVGIYGWNWDAYNVSICDAILPDGSKKHVNMIFIQGYRNFPSGFDTNKQQDEFIKQIDEKLDNFLHGPDRTEYRDEETRKNYEEKLFKELVEGCLKLM